VRHADVVGRIADDQLNATVRDLPETFKAIADENAMAGRLIRILRGGDIAAGCVCGPVSFEAIHADMALIQV
jgi:hypothetical protein